MEVNKEVIDFLLEYFKLNDLTELNLFALSVLDVYANMEKQGFSVLLFKNEIKEDNTVVPHAFQVPLFQILESLRKGRKS